MANKSLFKSLIGKLMPATDAPQRGARRRPTLGRSKTKVQTLLSQNKASETLTSLR